MSYPEVLKARMIRRMAGPQRQSAKALAAETGISPASLSRWLAEAGGDMKNSAQQSPQVEKSAVDQVRRPRDFSAVERAEIVVQAAALRGEERGIFLRQRGLFEDNIQSWIKSLEGRPCEKLTARSTGQTRKIAELERELRRKDKALAEAAALLVLKKKLGILLEDDVESSTANKPGRR